MECGKCGAKNDNASRFCANCGAELKSNVPSNVDNPCRSCGAPNPKKARFCAHCGVDLKRHEHRKTRRPVRADLSKRSKRRKLTRRRYSLFKMNPGVVALGLVGIAMIYVLASEYVFRPRPESTPQLFEVRRGDPTIEATVLEVASKFVCSCGACGEIPLDQCTCDRAKEERQFIRNYLGAGKSSEEVALAVIDTYGWIKPEFDSLLVGGHSGEASSQGAVGLDGIRERVFESPAMPSLASKLATLSDRTEIYSHFSCPCGQCEEDELKDCHCNHPRGALEVKAYIEKKIAEGKYTVGELIAEVDKTYGGRKL